MSSNVAGFLSLFVAICSFAALPICSKSVRPLLYAITSISSASALTNFRIRNQQQMILMDHEKIADQIRQNSISDVLRNEAEIAFNNSLFNRNIPINNQPIYQANYQQDNQQDNQQSNQQNESQFFDWANLSDEVEYPHIAILNKTGGGKSTLAQWLAKSLGGTIYAVDPHWEPGSYSDANLIIGKGRNVGESAESYQEITNKKGEVTGVKGEPEIALPHELCTVTQFMNWLHREMDARYRLRMEGINDFEQISVIFDEFSSYSKKEGFSTRFKELIRESRKVKIRMFILIQGSQVGELGLEGSSDLRSNLTFIRLGKFAIEYAESKLRNTKPNTDAYSNCQTVLSLLKKANRPALIEEDIVADVPDLS